MTLVACAPEWLAGGMPLPFIGQRTPISCGCSSKCNKHIRERTCMPYAVHMVRRGLRTGVGSVDRRVWTIDVIFAMKNFIQA